MPINSEQIKDKGYSQGLHRGVIGGPIGPLRVADRAVAEPADGHLLRAVDDHHGAGDERGGQPDDRRDGQVAPLAHPRLQWPDDGHVPETRGADLTQFPLPLQAATPNEFTPEVGSWGHKLIIEMHG